MAYINPENVANGGTGLNATTANQLLYSSSNNVIAGLTTANGGVLTTFGGVPSINNVDFTVLSTGVQMKGNNAATTPPTGFIGQPKRSYISNTSSIVLSTTVTKQIVNIALTAGIWDVSALVGYVMGTTTVLNVAQASISTTISNIAGNFGDDSINFQPGSINVDSQPVFDIPKLRVIVSTTTTWYLNANATFTTSTCAVYGRISATRVG